MPGRATIAGAKMIERENLQKPNEAVIRRLLEAIERVRKDVEMVEFWADAVTGFTQPVPDYDPGKATVWMPLEQARRLREDAS
jgi:hypothetical protein